MPVDRTTEAVVRLLRRSQPLREFPISGRYTITILLVLLCFAARYALEEAYPYPYLFFMPAIIFSSFIFDRGAGFLATFSGAALALHFFIEPRQTFVPRDLGTLLSVALFTLIGLITAAIIEALRRTVEELVVANENLLASRVELDDSHNLLQTVVEGSSDPIFVKDLQGRWVLANTALAQVIGVPKESLIGRRERDFLPSEEARQIESMDRTVMETRSPFAAEELISVAGKGPRWFLTTKAPWYGPDGKLSGLICIGRDIHERKTAEEESRAANSQKDLLLHDINHRVKNHLQSVMAALSISRRNIADEAAREAVDVTMSRLSVLARVYDRLELKPGGEAVVSAREFIEGLCDDLKPTLFDLRPVALRVEVEDVMVELGRAVSIGLVINEALTNALKYAFPDERAGNVTVGLARKGDMLRLEVADDGVGRGSEPHAAGTGTRLIRALAQQLGGRAQWLGSPGTRLVLEFPAGDRG